MVDGLAQLIPPEDLSVIVNTGDDFEHLGLYISPDLDTICYTLAGMANSETGWGRQTETYNALENIKILGGQSWFSLGDKDIATHIERTVRLKKGETLTQITIDFCKAWGIKSRILPMSDDPIRTLVDTLEKGELPFQEYFVHLKCEPKVKGFRFGGIEKARPAQGVIEAITESDAVVICPSNPWVSIDPILSLISLAFQLPENRLWARKVIAVTPIIGGKSVKGPAAKMFSELGIDPSPVAVALHYGNILSGFVLDETDAIMASVVPVPSMITSTLMKTQSDRKRLAQDVLHLIQSL